MPRGGGSGGRSSSSHSSSRSSSSRSSSSRSSSSRSSSSSSRSFSSHSSSSRSGSRSSSSSSRGFSSHSSSSNSRGFSGSASSGGYHGSMGRPGERGGSSFGRPDRNRGMFGGAPRGPVYSGGGGHMGGPAYGRSGGSGCLGGCLMPALRAFAYLFVILLIFEGTIWHTPGKEKLDSSLCVKSSVWYEDEWGTWIVSESKLISGLEYFYGKTGVQPFLLITGENGKNYENTSALERLANNTYNSLYNDEGHLVLVFREYPDNSGYYLTTVVVGTDAESVMDADAREILLDALDDNYYNESLYDEEYFTESFRQAADKIMSSSPTSEDEVINALMVGIFVVILFMMIRKDVRRFKYGSGRTEETKEENTKAQTDAKDETINTEEKHSATMVTVTCPHCGATVRVPKGGSGTCPYCGSSVSEK